MTVYILFFIFHGIINGPRVCNKHLNKRTKIDIVFEQRCAKSIWSCLNGYNTIIQHYPQFSVVVLHLKITIDISVISITLALIFGCYHNMKLLNLYIYS